MTARDVSFDPVIFPNPHTFDPNRWIRAAEQGHRLDKYAAAFGKGAFACVGAELAKSEIILGVAALVDRFDIELVDFNYERDLKVVRDAFFGLPSKESTAVRVRVMQRQA